MLRGGLESDRPRDPKQQKGYKNYSTHTGWSAPTQEVATLHISYMSVLVWKHTKRQCWQRSGGIVLAGTGRSNRGAWPDAKLLRDPVGGVLGDALHAVVVDIHDTKPHLNAIAPPARTRVCVWVRACARERARARGQCVLAWHVYSVCAHDNVIQSCAKTPCTCGRCAHSHCTLHALEVVQKAPSKVAPQVDTLRAIAWQRVLAAPAAASGVSGQERAPAPARAWRVCSWNGSVLLATASSASRLRTRVYRAEPHAPPLETPAARAPPKLALAVRPAATCSAAADGAAAADAARVKRLQACSHTHTKSL